MGIFDFVKDVGEKLFGDDQEEKAAEEAAAKAAEQAATEAEAAAVGQQARNLAIAEAITKLIHSMNLKVDDLHVEYADGRATIFGSTPSQAEREKIILLVGNSQGIGQVDDQLQVEASEAAAVFYTVVKGDTLSKIAKAQYGDPMKYPVIFEANRPMLKDPDLIYPGQQLRIPPLG